MVPSAKVDGDRMPKIGRPDDFEARSSPKAGIELLEPTVNDLLQRGLVQIACGSLRATAVDWRRGAFQLLEAASGRRWSITVPEIFTAQKIDPSGKRSPTIVHAGHLLTAAAQFSPRLRSGAV
jgi:hypothetical protein